MEGHGLKINTKLLADLAKHVQANAAALDQCGAVSSGRAREKDGEDSIEGEEYLRNRPVLSDVPPALEAYVLQPYLEEGSGEGSASRVHSPTRCQQTSFVVQQIREHIPRLSNPHWTTKELERIFFPKNDTDVVVGAVGGQQQQASPPLQPLKGSDAIEGRSAVEQQAQSLGGTEHAPPPPLSNDQPSPPQQSQQQQRSAQQQQQQSRHAIAAKFREIHSSSLLPSEQWIATKAVPLPTLLDPQLPPAVMCSFGITAADLKS